MIKQILDFLLQFWTYLRFWDVLDQENVGVVRRLGVLVRDMKPGVNWRWPIIESSVIFNAQWGALVLDPQSLRTKDGVMLVLRLKIGYQVTDARAHALGMFDAANNIQDVAAGELGEAVQQLDAADVYSGKVLQRVTRRVKAQAKKWGMDVGDAQFIDAAPARSLRLWNSTFTSAGQE
jgi:regulator of protease activity HflC (stomatin/prohibitin superfamily)